MEDFVFLIEKEELWASVLTDVLSKNDIPFITKNLLGAGITSRLGSLCETVQIYVPQEHYQAAKDISDELFEVGYEDINEME